MGQWVPQPRWAQGELQAAESTGCTFPLIGASGGGGGGGIRVQSGRPGSAAAVAVELDAAFFGSTIIDFCIGDGGGPVGGGGFEGASSDALTSTAL